YHINKYITIDMVCYRRHGHNEGDDPKFTQPEMYSFINNHPNPREIYSQKLIERGDLDKGLADEMEKSFWNVLQERLDEVKENPLPYKYQQPERDWRELKKITSAEDYETSPATGIEQESLDKIINHLMNLPSDFTPLSKVKRLFKGKQKLLDNNKMDWAMAELSAYASILLEGKDVRMSGQDVKRGTFSHRHAILRDGNTFEEFNRLHGMAKGQGKFRIFNSLLSEFAVMGFEYGYSLATPNALVIWEAQFGDFSNGAQSMFDQFLAAAESKWRRMSGLTLLLPHGYAGQGPEHSSARLERYLQACAEYNLTVANVTTPANFFHLIRRQLERPFRKPLVVMSPKSLLRHPECVSDVSEFTSGSNFKEVIDDATIGPRSGKKVNRVLLCTGKIYYDLLAKQREDKRSDIAIVRLEQLYPLPMKQIEQLLTERYSNAEVYWVQEEPANMGAWSFILTNYEGRMLKLISRKASASPATGFKKVHDQQQAEIINKAFA
ncbi:MAG: thiamine pyrophosphate-dependent enzyme, partial [Bacteroidota bacterium]